MWISTWRYMSHKTYTSVWFVHDVNGFTNTESYNDSIRMADLSPT
jgi:hypothetical protein